MIKIFNKQVLPLYYFGSIKQFKMPDLGESKSILAYLDQKSRKPR